jgi:hypothetical protein
MLDKIEALPERLGAVETLLADAGYFSAANVEACREASLEPLIAMGRQPQSLAWRALREGGVRTGKSDAGRGPGPSAEDARRPQALCFAQADAGAGVRHHQVGARIPPVFVARSRQSARRVEPRDHGVEPEADVCPRPRLPGRQASPAPAKQASEAPKSASQPRSERIPRRKTFQLAKIARAKTPVRQAASKLTLKSGLPSSSVPLRRSGSSEPFAGRTGKIVGGYCLRFTRSTR